MQAFWRGLEEIFRDVDQTFALTKRQFPKEVRCRPGCVDCCYALFDLSLAEAFVLHREFRRLPRKVRREVLRRLEKYEKEWQKKAPEVITPFVLSTVRIRCPLLGDDKRCVLYHARPVTCRLYGVPVALGEETFVCGHSGFEPGRSYPTVLFHKVQARLASLSEKLAPQGDRLRISLGNALRGLFPGVHLLTE